MVRLGVLSFWHVHADDYARQAAAHPDAELVAVWDENEERGRLKAAEWGVQAAPSLDALLARRDVDAVVVTGPTTGHRDLIVQAASAGKHIFTEKLLAPTVRECEDIVAAVDRVGVTLMVSLPSLTTASTLAVQALLAEGALGSLTMARVRRSHNGASGAWLPERFFVAEETAGGALFDLGCHPMYLVRTFLGMPSAVSASYGYVTRRGVDDNAIAVLTYANGALGIVETSFVQDASYAALELHGSEGTAVMSSADGRLLVRRVAPGVPAEWQERALGQDGPRPFAQWMAHVQAGTRDLENVQLALDLTLLMEASDRSARSGRTVALSEIEDPV
jgi:1,5-anhydro-D-fructose reductase (1,5-anhydro-D-mannitol-forming)